MTRLIVGRLAPSVRSADTCTVTRMDNPTARSPRAVVRSGPFGLTGDPLAVVRRTLSFGCPLHLRETRVRLRDPSWSLLVLRGLSRWLSVASARDPCW